MYNDSSILGEVFKLGKYFNKELFAQRLTELMTENSDDTYSLGAFLGLTPPTISRYCTASMAAKTTTIEVIARKYGVNPAWLMGTEGQPKFLIGDMPPKKLPVLGVIAAGQPISAIENIIGYEYVPTDTNADFCLKVKGDSMINARIYDGDVVFIRQQPDAENGEIAAVIIDGEEATLKRVYHVDGNIILRPENPNYKDIVFSKKDKKVVQILGKAIYFKSEVK
jgi:repressor LexA